MKIFKTKKYTILSNILKYSFVFVFAFMLFVPVIFAGTGTTGTGITSTIDNPLGTTGPQTIPDFIKIVINIVLVVGVPIVALAIIYTGFLFVEAQGSPEKITKAKKALTYTIIGAAILLGAFVIADAIGKTVDEIKSST
jgi:hypothetical protein